MPKFTARTADKHFLYQESVQSAEAEVWFMDRIYSKRHGRKPALMREDFCGTALVSCEWAKARPDNVAYGVDLDGPTLDWGRANNIAKLPNDVARRVRLIQDNVLHVTQPKVDVVCALNFSYFIFKTRVDLVAYFKKVRASLRPDGLFILDAYGGWESQQVVSEKTRYKGFTYYWEQSAYNPINDHTTCHISFRFPDGTRMRHAFTYDWRLWTLGGIGDALADAGFSSHEVYWEGTTKDGDGSGVYRQQLTATNSEGWNAYIVGVP